MKSRTLPKAYGSHANSYVVKPLEFKKFTELMRDLGFYWLGWNENPFAKDGSRRKREI